MITSADMFQFQTGSIKSADIMNREWTDAGFNSKLVRLKAH